MGGVLMGLGWWLVGLLAFVSIVGIPWGKACFVIGQFAFWPFGKEAVSRDDLSGREDIGTGALGLVGNIIWFVLAGVWLAIGHVLSAAACFITIIGIPFGIQHLKLAGIALAPIGKTIVEKELAAAVRGENAQADLSRRRDA
ncbi:MAG: YccF domain-containing protein [Propionivibrio sp.]|nr:YccF domain-containing protein [Propionivibrio sp.]